MSLVTWWVGHRQANQIGDDLDKATDANELMWWQGERRRLFWKYALRQALPITCSYILGGLLLAAHRRHFGFGDIVLVCIPGAVAGYVTARMTVDRHRALSIRRKRLRDGLLAPTELDAP